MEPTCGRIVHYRLRDDDCHRHCNDEGARHQSRAGDVVPLLVVRVWPDEYVSGGPGEWVEGEWRPFEVLSPFGINGQAFLDGNCAVWITSASQGENPGQWNWPPRV